MSTEGSLFIHSATFSHLRAMGHPEKAVRNIEMCGTHTGDYLLRTCGCEGKEYVPIVKRCNNRSCVRCSKVRKTRIMSRYIPFFGYYKKDRVNFFQFLTISPRNYENLEDGVNHIRKSFQKFLRKGYNFEKDEKGRKRIKERVSDRIKAGFYVIEAKDIGNKWNIHIHAVLYGSWIDYRIRGKCMECNQNLLKYDKEGKRFYCANKKCNSINVIKNDNTKLGRIWKECSGEASHIYGEVCKSIYGAASYLSKYVSKNEETFSDPIKKAEFIKVTYKKRLINPIGNFYSEGKKIKRIKINYICQKCFKNIIYQFDYQVNLIMRESDKKKNIKAEDHRRWLCVPPPKSI